MKKAVKIIVNILAWVLLMLALLITIVVFSAERNNGVSNIMGYMPMTVESDSMSPTFKKGDLIIVKEINDINKLEEDDVITFWTLIDGNRVKNTHRIVGITRDDQGQIVSFTTRGDNNNGVNDELPAYPKDIVGKWTGKHLKGCGKALDFLRTKKGFFICIIIPLAAFFLFELYKFIATLVEIKKGDAPEQLDEEEIKRRAIEEYLAEQKKKEAEKEGASAEAKEAVTEKAEEVKEAVTEKAETAAEEVREAVTEKAEPAAEEVKEAVTEKAETAEEAVKEVVTETAGAAAEEIKEAAAEAAEDITGEK
ncbi:MAG: signal peptidase I [Ruminococcus sp.]|nr:signal peptidase I [Ruminococcus sp.]